jgi:hypothetical protein
MTKHEIKNHPVHCKLRLYTYHNKYNMARTVAQIQSLMNADIQANPILNPGTPNTPGLTSTSKRAIWNLWTFIFATAINLLESLIDIFKAQVEATAAAAAPASAAWLQNQVMLFQYDPVTPQIIQLVNFAPAYPVIDATKQIISRASVTTTVAGQTLIKVATGSPAPGALNTSQLSALQAYVNAIGATLSYVVSSVAADQLYVAAEVYYAGQYAAIIQSTVINAITNLLAAGHPRGARR